MNINRMHTLELETIAETHRKRYHRHIYLLRVGEILIIVFIILSNLYTTQISDFGCTTAVRLGCMFRKRLTIHTKVRKIERSVNRHETLALRKPHP